MEYIRQTVADLADEALCVRQALHQIPERGFKEYKTQQYIIDYLEALGLKPEKIVETGVCVYFNGDGTKDETIAFRTDMDGLDLKEGTGLPFVSQHEGMMHGCGHDGHMTIMLLFAKYLAEHPELNKRNILLIFQPAEEGPGGAQPVVQSGLLERYFVSAVFGFHIFPFIPQGFVATAPGPIIAMTSEFYVDIIGKGGHAANPDQCVDAIVASADYVSALQKIVSRMKNPFAEAIISVGTINGGTRMNVVADRVSLSGTMRSFNEDTHKTMQYHMKEMAKGIESMYGCKVDLRFVDMYPPVNNNPDLYEKVWPLLGDATQKQHFDKQMIAEDFAYYSKAVPSLFMGLGSGNAEKGMTSGLHSPDFNFDEAILLRGVETYLRIALSEEQYKINGGNNV